MNKKPNKIAHTPNTLFGHGDYYGSGIRQKMGKTRESFVGMFVPPKKLGKPPKSLA